MSRIYNAEVPKKIAEDELRRILKVDGDKYVIEIPVPNNCPAIYEVMIQEGKSKDDLHVIVERKA